MQAKENQLYKCTVMKLHKLFSHCYKLLKFQKARFTGKCISISCFLSVLKFNDPYRLWGRFWVQTVWLAWGFCLYTTPPCSQEFLAFHINHTSHLYSQQRCDRSPISSVKCKYTYHSQFPWSLVWKQTILCCSLFQLIWRQNVETGTIYET